MSGSPSKLRICHLASGDLWAGAEVMVSVMAEALVDRAECEVRAILLNAGRLQDRLDSLGIPFRIIPETRLGPVSLFKAIITELRNTKCDILHSHRYKENILGTLAAKYAGVPVCVRTVHGSPEPFRGLAKARMTSYIWLDRLVQRHLNDQVIVVARYLKSEVSAYLREEQIAVIHNALPESDSTTRRRGQTQDVFTIGWAGRMVTAKSLDVLLRAVARLRDSMPGIRLRLAGDGPEKKKLIEFVVANGMKDVVEFCGIVDNMSTYLSTLDVFVLPSRQEGIPISLLEAMRAGIPVVASAVGGIPEVIAHRRNGVLVPPEDVDALVMALKEMVSDGPFQELLRAEAKTTFSSKFSSHRLGAELISLYTNLLVSKNHAAFPRAVTGR